MLNKYMFVNHVLLLIRLASAQSEMQINILEKIGIVPSMPHPHVSRCDKFIMLFRVIYLQ